MARGHRTGETEQQPGVPSRESSRERRDHGKDHACLLSSMDPPRTPAPPTADEDSESHCVGARRLGKLCLRGQSCLHSKLPRYLKGERRRSPRSLGAPQQTEDEPHSTGTGTPRLTLGEFSRRGRKAAKGFLGGGPSHQLSPESPNNWKRTAILFSQVHVSWSPKTVTLAGGKPHTLWGAVQMCSGEEHNPHYNPLPARMRGTRLLCRGAGDTAPGFIKPP